MNLFVKKAIANASWLMSEKILIMVANLAVSVVFARSLGPEGFGALSYLLAITSMVAPLAALGLNALVTRELVNNPDNQDQIIATTVAMRFVGALVGSFLCVIVAVLGLGLKTEEGQVGLLILALGNVFTCFSVLEFWFQAKVAAKIVARMRLSIILVFSILKLASVIFLFDFIVIISIFSIEVVVTGLGFIYIFRSQGNTLNFSFVCWKYGISLLKQSFWLILSGFAAIIYLKIDQVMLEHLASTAEVGIYAVASRLSEVWYFFADAIVITLFPALLSYRKSGNSLKYSMSMQRLSDILFCAALVLAIFVSIVAPYVIELFFGKEYSESAVILQFHIWAALFVFMRSMVSKWLIAESLLKYSLLSHGVGAVFNVIANYYMIPIWEGRGAAVATVISYFSASYLAFWFSVKTRPVAVIMTKSILLPLTLGYRYWPNNRVV